MRKPSPFDNPNAFGTGPLGPNPYAFADAQRIRDQRWLDTAQGDMGRAISGGRLVGGPLPDSGWDSFFGALQRKGEDVAQAGGKFNVDLAGREGSGIGTLMAQDIPSGQTYNMDRGEIPPGLQQRAVRGLQSATRRRY